MLAKDATRLVGRRQRHLQRAFSTQYGEWAKTKLDDAGGLAVFGGYSEEYDRYRPTYPPTMWNAATTSLPPTPHLGVDVCAGTGRGTFELVSRNFNEVVAVDLDIGMLSKIDSIAATNNASNVRTIQTGASNLPLDSNSADLVVCLQAFHWLDAPKSLTEFSRVLKKDATALIAWNDRDLTDPFIRDWESLVEQRNDKYTRDIKISENYEHLLQCDALTPFTKQLHPNSQTITANGFVEQMKTFSYVKNALSDEDLNSLELETRALVKRYFEVEGDEGEFQLNWTTKAFSARAL